MTRHCRALGIVLTATLVVVVATTARAADLKVVSLFSGDMVLQRGRALPVWGEAESGVAIEVSFGDTRQAATAGPDGKWRVSLPAMEASAEPRTLKVSSAGTTVEFQNVLVGDVWVCSGQSNMAMNLKETQGGAELAKTAVTMKTLRLLTVPKRPADAPKAEIDAKWRLCSPESARDFAAVGFYFGAELQKAPELAGIPIGLIDCSVGGTAIEAWISKDALDTKPADQSPSLFGIPSNHLFNAIIAPVTQLPVKGALWYQGESNSGRPDLYTRLLRTMIADWRKRWDDPAMPFLIVQLPAFVEPKFTWVREAEAEAVKVTPNTALAVTIDTCDGQDLHPKEKQEVGRRLALAARRVAYGAPVVSDGPAFRSATSEGDAIRVTFDTHGEKLAGRHPANDVLRGFAVAGDDGLYHFADAKITGDNSVIVRTPAVPSPKTVRYAWGAVPDADLTNASGLPAAPFRTDTLPRSNVEVLSRPAPQRVATSAYEIEIAGDGSVRSLAVRGHQFLSSAPGGAGGVSIPFFLGPRNLADVRRLGPDLLSCGDSDVTLTMKFAEQSMEWTIENRSKSALQFRIALATKVQVSGPERGAVRLSRDKSILSIGGVDAVSNGDDGKVLEVKVEDGHTRRIDLNASAADVGTR